MELGKRYQLEEGSESAEALELLEKEEEERLQNLEQDCIADDAEVEEDETNPWL